MPGLAGHRRPARARCGEGCRDRPDRSRAGVRLLRGSSPRRGAAGTPAAGGAGTLPAAARVPLRPRAGPARLRTRPDRLGGGGARRAAAAPRHLRASAPGVRAATTARRRRPRSGCSTWSTRKGSRSPGWGWRTVRSPPSSAARATGGAGTGRGTDPDRAGGAGGGVPGAVARRVAGCPGAGQTAPSAGRAHARRLRPLCPRTMCSAGSARTAGTCTPWPRGATAGRWWPAPRRRSWTASSSSSPRSTASTRSPSPSAHRPAASSRSSRPRNWCARRIRVEVVSESGEVSQRSWLHPRSFTAADVVDRVRWQLQGGQAADSGLSSPVSRVRVTPEAVDAIGNHEDGLWGTGPDERIHHGALPRAEHARPRRGAHRGGGRRAHRWPTGRTWWRGATGRRRRRPPAAAVARAAAHPGAGDRVRDAASGARAHRRRAMPCGSTIAATLTAPPGAVLGGRHRHAAAAGDRVGGAVAGSRSGGGMPLRRGAVNRFQIVDSDGTAWLLVLEGEHWWAEARYD